MDSVIDLDDKIKLRLDQYKLITGDQGEQRRLFSFFSFSLNFTLLINIFNVTENLSKYKISPLV